jgi:hypothetical protein
MDKEVLKRQLTERFQASLEQALRAVDQAPDGQWIAASEWQVRGIFQKLTGDCYEQMIQQRIDALPSACRRTAFSPGTPSDGVAEQGNPRCPGAHRRR